MPYKAVDGMLRTSFCLILTQATEKKKTQLSPLSAKHGEHRKHF